MEYRRFDDTIVARLDTGEEVISSIAALCKKENLLFGTVIGLGAVSEAEVGCFDTVLNQYYAKPYRGIYEIASLFGTISVKDSEPFLHVHAVLADREGAAIGGHLNRGIVSATCELTLRALSGAASRRQSEKTGLYLLTFEE